MNSLLQCGVCGDFGDVQTLGSSARALYSGLRGAQDSCVALRSSLHGSYQASLALLEERKREFSNERARQERDDLANELFRSQHNIVLMFSFLSILKYHINFVFIYRAA